MKYPFPPILFLSICLILASCSDRKEKTDKQIQRAAIEQEKINTFLESRPEKFEQLESGIWVSIVETGDSIHPVLSSSITTAYRTESLTGILVDSATVARPLRIRLARLIEGWQLALPLIGQGGQLKMVIPAALAYKERSIHPQLAGWTPLYFEISLLSVDLYQP